MVHLSKNLKYHIFLIICQLTFAEFIRSSSAFELPPYLYDELRPK